jgi:pimeloyl-ACP methyl ester carboxylesterase
MSTIAWSQNLTPETAAEHGARAVTKQQLFTESDVLSIHVVLSERTRGLAAAAELRSMKPSAILVNTSRGPFVDEAALVGVLSEGRIRAPVLILSGADDPLITREVVASAVAPRFDQAQSTVTEIGQASHWPHAERPAAVAGEIDRFLDRVE